MKFMFSTRSLSGVISVGLVLFAGWSLIQFSGCADDPLFAPEPPSYRWNPGILYADSVGYNDDDSITLHGHFKPKAFVITVRSFWISVIEEEAGIVKTEDIHYLLKDVVWSFKPENYADTLVEARLKIPRVISKPSTAYYFRVHLNIVPPPGYPASTGLLKSNSMEIDPTGGG